MKIQKKFPHDRVDDGTRYQVPCNRAIMLNTASEVEFKDYLKKDPRKIRIEVQWVHWCGRLVQCEAREKMYPVEDESPRSST